MFNVEILGMKISSPLAASLRIVASMTLGRTFMTANLIPSHSFGGLRLGRRIIAQSCFKSNLWVAHHDVLMSSETHSNNLLFVNRSDKQ